MGGKGRAVVMWAGGLVLTLLAPEAMGQPPGHQHRVYLPEPLGASGGDTAREFGNIERLLRKGSAADRLQAREELMRDDRLLGPMVDLLTSTRANHFLQRQALLVLMQSGDDRVTPFLERLVGDGRRGARGVGALTLGRIGRPESLPALVRLAHGSQMEERLMAHLAMGRLGGPAAAEVLREFLASDPPSREQAAAALALGWTGQEVGRETLTQLAGSSKADLRRAAVVAAAFLDPEAAVPLLLSRCDPKVEEDDRVRRAALACLCGFPANLDAYAALKRMRPSEVSDASEEAEWILACAALGRAEEAKGLAQGLTSPREEVRCAVAAASLLLGQETGLALARAALRDSKDRVTRVALLACLGLTTDNVGLLGLSGYVRHSDEVVRRLAVLGDVYLLGEGARRTLESYLDVAFKDDVRELAKLWLALLGEDARSARRRAGAELQVQLDQEGWSAGWRASEEAHLVMIRVLGLENALNRRGAGVAPGTSGPDRSRGAVATAPTPEEEDLRRHLDRHPFMDRRRRREIPDFR